jgi:hypothetical protein
MFYRSRGAMLGLVAVLSVGGVLVRPTEAKAYSLEGLRWPGQPTSGCCANLTVEYLTVSQSYDLAGYFSGFIDWNNAWGSGVNVNVTSVSSSRWTADDLYNPNFSWDGLTTISPQLNGQYFNAVSMHLNSYWTQIYSQSVINALAAHEIGHGLGLADVNACVLMQPQTQTRIYCGVYGPQQDDKNGVNAQY